MKRLLPLLLLATGCHRLPPPTPLADLNPQQSHGHEVFRAHCASCHNDRNADPLHGPGLAGIYKKPYLPSGAPANDDRVLNVIAHGHNLMPAVPNLDPQDTDDLLAYLHTL